MAYFLKKNIKNGKVYLSIVNSFYSNEKKQTVHKTYASYGTGASLINDGISDPVAYLQNKVKQLNEEKETNHNTLFVSDVAPYVYSGHFLLKAVLDKLDIQSILNIYDMTTHFQFKLYDILSSLIFARCIKPVSKYKTYVDVIPYLGQEYNFSYDQLLNGLAYLGDNYERIVEIFTKLIKNKYSINTNINYFDCTNFYFEIDKEDDFRRKGPSKENRKEPLLGMGLLLDANQIPIGLKLFPGNESEKPKIREIIEDLKESNSIDNKIIQVADKGLNCARNIYEALKNNDGYIFSKSCKTLIPTEKTWVLLDNDYVEVKNNNGKVLYKIKECVDTFKYSFKNDEGKEVKFKTTEKRVAIYNPKLAAKQLLEIKKLEEKAINLCLSKAKKEEFGECSKYVQFQGKDGSKAETSINYEKLEKDKQMCGYNLLVTSEIKASHKEIYRVYHNLWRIEESFRIMKSELDARPVYLKTKSTIYGHFLICYLSTVIIRLLQIYELKDEESYQEIFKFIKEFVLIKRDDIGYINMITQTEFLDKLCQKTKLPLKNAIINEKQYKKIMSYKL